MKFSWNGFLKRGLTGQIRGKHGLLSFLLLYLLVTFFTSPDSFAGAIKSRAALTVDASTGEILYSKNSTWRLAPASTTKLMTAILAIEKEDLSKVVTVSQKASRTAPTRVGFKKGDEVTIEGLLYAALLRSANDAAVALAEAVSGSEQEFVSLMNQKALSIGAEDTKFINATGLPGNGQYTTAFDLSKILNYSLGMPRLREIIGTAEAKITTAKGKVFHIKSTDKLLWWDDKIIGGKTGYTNKAGHCFVGAARGEGKTILVAILGSHCRKDLWREAKKLVANHIQAGVR